MVGMSNTPGGVVDATLLLLLKVGVGLLSAGGSPSGGVGRRGVNDVAGADSEWWLVVSWLWFSRGGGGAASSANTPFISTFYTTLYQTTNFKPTNIL